MLENKTYKVIKDKLTNRVSIPKILGRERGTALRSGEIIEVTKEELDLMKINQWVKLNKEVKNGN